ncbi:MAG: RecX family transcriptional regulator [Bacteroidales bacterium]|nr:RecX family transcriptional regulator [Bacteroidales bacterium]
MEATELNRHLVWAERLCSRREYCGQEMRVKLMAKGLDRGQIEGLIAALRERNFINEERYVRAFVHDKSKLQGWGVEKIRYALRAKLIPDAVIGEGLGGIDAEEQRERLRRLLGVKKKSVKGASEADVRVKLIRFGLTRGFSYGDVVMEVGKI